MITKIMFDVGANFGTSSLDFIQSNEDYICHSFEPTPMLSQNLIDQAALRGISDRYIVVEKAVSDFNGVASFNIAGQADWGCSSLLNFSKNLDKTWPGRTDFKVTETINVEVITLETYINSLIGTTNEIKIIDKFHCDAQGNDLKVLQGMGAYINLIVEGEVEAARDSSVALYENQHTISDVENFLLSNNFIVSNVQSNDCHNNEFNLFFKKSL